MKKKTFMGYAAAMAIAAGILLTNPNTAMAAEEQTIPKGVFVGEFDVSGMTAEEAKQMVQEHINSLAGQKVTLRVDGNPVATTAAELGFQWTNQEELDQIANIDISGSLIEQYMALRDLEVNNLVIDLKTTLDDAAITNFVQEKCAPFTVKAKDATIKKTGNGFSVTDSVVGREVDTAATMSALQAALDQGLENEITVDAVVVETQPKRTREALSQIKDELGSYSTVFNSGNASRTTNLKTGTSKINGTVLMPGETLSGYELMHPFTVENGYATASAYENGVVVDSVGGGACQIATTLYNAALLSEIKVSQRQNHSMTVSYVPHSMDAAIAGTYKDIKLTNEWDFPVYVEGWVSGNKIGFAIYGKETRPSNRTIKYVSETLSEQQPGDPIVTFDPSLPLGVQVTDQGGYPGVKARLWKHVYVDGKEVEKTLLHTDTYNMSQARIRIGSGAPAETAPAETPANTTPQDTPPAETQPDTSAAAVEGANGGPGVTPTEAAETQPQGPGVN